MARRLSARPYPKKRFFKLLGGLFKENPALLYEILLAQGFPLEERSAKVFLKTATTSFLNQEFVVVDIETNGNKPQKAQIIEIGAIKFKGDKILGRFESLVYADEIPEYISKLTGIYPYHLLNAPSEKEVLLKFKAFLQDAVFIAHNVEFDYNFISQKLKQLGFGELSNRKLCSIDLAKRTIPSPRYGLEFLNRTLKIDVPISHRAYADAFTAFNIVQQAFKRVPLEVQTTEELLLFSKSGYQPNQRDLRVEKAP